MVDQAWVGTAVDVVSLLCFGVGIWIVVTFFPLLGRFLPEEDNPPVWPLRVGATLVALALAYLMASPLQVVFSAFGSLVQLWSLEGQPASASAFFTAWGTGTVSGELAANLGTFLVVFGAFVWIGLSIRERFRAHPFVTELNGVQYWFVVFAAASLVWRAAQSIWLQILLVRPPSLMASASARGMSGFIVGLAFGLVVTILVIAFLYNSVASEYEQREVAPDNTGP